MFTIAIGLIIALKTQTYTYNEAFNVNVLFEALAIFIWFKCKKYKSNKWNFLCRSLLTRFFRLWESGGYFIFWNFGSIKSNACRKWKNGKNKKMHYKNNKISSGNYYGESSVFIAALAFNETV